MIQARFYCVDNGLHMELTGHAGAAPVGQDPVCAAASALGYTLAGAVARMHGAGMLRRAPGCRMEKGLGRVAAVPGKRHREAVQMAFWTVQCGMAALAEQFPEHVQLTEVMQVKEVKQ